MKLLASLALALSIVGSASAGAVELSKRAAPQGIDVSAYQPNIDWAQVKSNGIEFAYIKATEGTGYKSPQFNSQYTGATRTGLIRGAYHFARPDVSSGGAQAQYFVRNGGGWTSDGVTLPGAVDLEYNPYGSNKCYGLSAGAMVNWVRDFSDTYNRLVGRYPVIYTSTSWWRLCTSDFNGFGATNPLWVARYASSVSTLPAGWRFYTFWQYSDSAKPNPGDANVFNGDSAGLNRLARG